MSNKTYFRPSFTPFPTRSIRIFRLPRPRPAMLSAVLILFVATTGLAHAQNAISVRSGSFTPWLGETGISAALQYTHQLGDRHHLGAEFEYRSFEGEVAKIENIDLEHYIQRFVYRADLIISGAVTPYIGLGLGVGAANFSKGRVEAALNFRDPGSDFKSRSAFLLDVLGVAGVDVAVPKVEWLSFFGEARVSYTAQFTAIDDRNRGWNIFGSTIDERETDESGGVSAHAGLRFRF